KEHCMSIEEVKRRFVEEVKLRAYDDKYIDKNEEREILQIAIQQGIGVDPARAALVQVCDSQGYVLESKALQEIKGQVETAAGNDGVIDQKEFELIVGNAKRLLQGKKNDVQVKRMVVEVMEDSGLNKVKTGWFSNWYAKVKKEVGL